MNKQYKTEPKSDPKTIRVDAYPLASHIMYYNATTEELWDLLKALNPVFAVEFEVDTFSTFPIFRFSADLSKTAREYAKTKGLTLIINRMD